MFGFKRVRFKERELNARNEAPCARRLRIVASVALASSLALTGCSGAPAQGGGGTVHVQVEASKLADFQAVADGFQQANPGLHVGYETITSDQKAITNGLTPASQDAPDLGLAPINATSYSQLRYGGGLLPLSGSSHLRWG